MKSLILGRRLDRTNTTTTHDNFLSVMVQTAIPTKNSILHYCSTNINKWEKWFTMQK